MPVGAYVSGGLDSSIVAALARRGAAGSELVGFTGRFDAGAGVRREPPTRGRSPQHGGFPLEEIDDRRRRLRRDTSSSVVYHLDYPGRRPGLVPAVHGLALAAQQRKVVLGGQGGDEIFGGYARYLIAYFEQCIKAAIDGTMHDGNFVVTYESIIPNLTALANYKPLLQEFWREGLFDDLDERYFRLINRAPDLGDEIDWDAARRLLALRDASARSSAARTSARSRTSTR